MDYHNSGLGYSVLPEYGWTPHPRTDEATPYYSNGGAYAVLPEEQLSLRRPVATDEFDRGSDPAERDRLTVYRKPHYDVQSGDRAGVSKDMPLDASAGPYYPDVYSGYPPAVTGQAGPYGPYPVNPVAPEAAALARPTHHVALYGYALPENAAPGSYPQFPGPSQTNQPTAPALGKRGAPSESDRLRDPLEDMAAPKRAKALIGPSPPAHSTALPMIPAAHVVVAHPAPQPATPSPVAEPTTPCVGDRRWSEHDMRAWLSDTALANPKQFVIKYLRLAHTEALIVEVAREGPPHKPQFVAEVPFTLPDGTHVVGKGCASIKRAAERAACLDALMMLAEAGDTSALRGRGKGGDKAAACKVQALKCKVPAAATPATKKKKKKGASGGSEEGGTAGQAASGVGASRSTGGRSTLLVDAGGASCGGALSCGTAPRVGGADAGDGAKGHDEPTPANTQDGSRKGDGASNSCQVLDTARGNPQVVETSRVSPPDTDAPLAMLEERWGNNPKQLLIRTRRYESLVNKGDPPLPVTVQALEPIGAGFRAHMPVPLADGKLGHAEGQGRSKALAERLCAFLALEQLQAAGFVSPPALAASVSGNGGAASAAAGVGAGVSLGDVGDGVNAAVPDERAGGGAEPGREEVQVRVHADGFSATDGAPRSTDGQVAQEDAHKVQDGGDTASCERCAGNRAHGQHAGGGAGASICADENDGTTCGEEDPAGAIFRS
eukprot:jgi/Mesvir1/9293/Mv04472-RA.1